MKHRALRRGLSEIAADQEAFGSKVWEHLRRERPEVAAVFRRADSSAQARRIRGLIAFVVAHHDEAEVLIPVLRGIGARQAIRGLGRVHYEVVAHAVIDVLKEACGLDWSLEQSVVWRGFLGQLIDELVAAQATLASAS